MWKKPPPESRKPIDSVQEDGTTKVRRHRPALSIQERLLKGMVSYLNFNMHFPMNLVCNLCNFSLSLLLLHFWARGPIVCSQNVLYSAEFSCSICRKVMSLPLTTPCAHNFCKSCLESSFAGQTFMKQRTCEGGRTLRTQKNIMKCPSCPNDISDFLQNPQVSLAYPCSNVRHHF